jgi:DNA-binding NtrC family response regulator
MLAGAGKQLLLRLSMNTQPLHFENLNILVVEDDDSSYLLIEELLSIYKLNLIRASNAEQALLYIHSNYPLHLAIIDIKLPCNSDGLQLVSVIKKQRPGLGIIIQSALALNELQKRQILGLACDFFYKPLDLSLFFKVVYCHLEHQINLINSLTNRSAF